MLQDVEKTKFKSFRWVVMYIEVISLIIYY